MHIANKKNDKKKLIGHSIDGTVSLVKGGTNMKPLFSAVFTVLCLNSATVSADHIAFDGPRKFDVSAKEFQSIMNFSPMSKNSVVQSAWHTEKASAAGGLGIRIIAMQNHGSIAAIVEKVRHYDFSTLGNRFNFELPRHFFTTEAGIDRVTQSTSVPEPSLWKLFLLSLLWIPFNRWERKSGQPESGKNTNLKRQVC
jgi:hypothetical protein